MRRPAMSGSRPLNMLSALVASLNTLRDFVSRVFFMSAFIPTLVFLFANGLILYVWSWPFHRWAQQQFFNAQPLEKSLTFAILFFAVWLSSFIVAALTAFWIRTLEGTNWPDGLRKAGTRFHVAVLQKLEAEIDHAVEQYGRIEGKSAEWDKLLDDAAAVAIRPNPAKDKLDTPGRIELLRAKMKKDETITFANIKELKEGYAEDIIHSLNSEEAQSLAQAVQVLTAYAIERARREQARLQNIKNSDFGVLGEVRPTRFGNVGLVAEGYAKRAYGCNLVLIWSELQRAAENDDKTTKAAFVDCKMQLDFFVAFFWLLLALSVVWSLVFAWSGQLLCAFAFAVIGPLICWTLWYGAAVEQYRVLQALIISSLNGPLRFRVLRDLRFALPQDLTEERELWQAIDVTVGQGQPNNLKYQHPP